MESDLETRLRTVTGGGLGKADMKESAVDKWWDRWLSLLISLWKGWARKSWRESAGGPLVWNEAEAMEPPGRGRSGREESSISCQTSSIVLMHELLAEEGEGTKSSFSSVEDETEAKTERERQVLLLLPWFLWFYEEHPREMGAAVAGHIMVVSFDHRKQVCEMGDWT